MIRIPEYLERRRGRTARTARGAARRLGAETLEPVGDDGGPRSTRLGRAPSVARRRRGSRRSRRSAALLVDAVDVGRRRSTSSPAFDAGRRRRAGGAARPAAVVGGAITAVRRPARRRRVVGCACSSRRANAELAASRRDRQGPRPSPRAPARASPPALMTAAEDRRPRRRPLAAHPRHDDRERRRDRLYRALGWTPFGVVPEPRLARRRHARPTRRLLEGPPRVTPCGR